VTVLDFAILGAFIPASLVIILSPGADTFLLLRFAIKGGRADGFRAMFGILVGLSLVSLLLISGVGLVVSRFPLALDVLSVVGIAILLLLASISIRAGIALVRDPVPVSGKPAPPAERVGLLEKPFRMSLITNVTNPKVLIFYVAFFPQFLGTATSVAGQLTLLSVAFLVVSTIWLIPLVFVASAARAFFTRPNVAIAMEFSVASVFVLLAIALIFTM
jgi:threonine/homoserine/homoserine lactone efflux protein